MLHSAAIGAYTLPGYKLFDCLQEDLLVKLDSTRVKLSHISFTIIRTRVFLQQFKNPVWTWPTQTINVQSVHSITEFANFGLFYSFFDCIPKLLVHRLNSRVINISYPDLSLSPHCDPIPSQKSLGTIDNGSVTMNTTPIITKYSGTQDDLKCMTPVADVLICRGTGSVYQCLTLSNDLLTLLRNVEHCGATLTNNQIHYIDGVNCRPISL